MGKPDGQGPKLKLPNKELKELYSRIKPVVRFNVEYKGYEAVPVETYDEGLLFYIKNVNPRDVSCVWDPEPTKQANDIERLDDIITYHTFGASVFFKPSIEEVLAQIPEQYLEQTVAFEIRTSALGPWNVVDRNHNSYHVTMTRLYKKIQTGDDKA
jgi:hypothetical protein